MKHFLFITLILFLFVFLSCSKPENTKDGISGKSKDGKIHLIYWRHHFHLEKIAIEKFIAEYEKKNPHVKIHFSTMPYSTYTNKLAASIAAGTGPHIINIHNSWAYSYVKSNLLNPIPDKIFTTEQIENDFFPVIKSFKHNGCYYGLPIGTGNLALFYNKKLFRKAGLVDKSGEPTPPKTWKEFVEFGKKLTKFNKKTKRLEISGVNIVESEGGQGWNYLVDGLFVQNGVQVVNDNGTKVGWDSKEGIEAFKFYTDFVMKHKICTYLFPKPYDSFKLGRCAMMINGNWTINSIMRDTYTKEKYEADKKANKKPKEIFEYGIAPLPKGKKHATYGGFWGNCVTRKAQDQHNIEAWKFLKYISSVESMTYWVNAVKELPMRKKVAKELKNKYPMLKAFIDQLPYTATSLKKDEAKYSLAIGHAIERVILKGISPEESLKIAAEEVNKLLQAQ